MHIRNQSKVIGRKWMPAVFLLSTFILMLVLFLLNQKPYESLDPPTADAVELIWYLDNYNHANTWGNDVTSKLFIEKTGLSVRFITSRTINDEYLSVMLAGKAAPDLVTLQSHSPQINKMINEGKAADLEILLSLLEPDSRYKAYLENSRYGDTLFLCPGIVGSEVDGSYHLYDMPALLVREDLYNQMGSPDMTTTEGFLQALSFVQHPDVAPLGLDAFTETGCDSIDSVLMQFLAVPYVQDEIAYDRYRDPSFIEWIHCLSVAYRQGFLLQDALLDSEEQVRNGLASGKYFAFMANAAKYELELQQSQHRYIAVEAPTNVRGDDPTIYVETETVGKYATLVNNSSQHKESAIELLSYFASETGQSDAYLGRIDVTYSNNSAGLSLLSHSVAMRDTSRNSYQEIYGGLFTYFMLANLDATQDLPQYRSSVLIQPFEWRAQYAVPASRLGIIKRELYRTYGSQLLLISQTWGKQLPSLLSSANQHEFNKTYQVFLDMRDEMGYQEIKAEFTRLLISGSTP